MLYFVSLKKYIISSRYLFYKEFSSCLFVVISRFCKFNLSNVMPVKFFMIDLKKEKLHPNNILFAFMFIIRLSNKN